MSVPFESAEREVVICVYFLRVCARQCACEDITVCGWGW